MESGSLGNKEGEEREKGYGGKVMGVKNGGAGESSVPQGVRRGEGEQIGCYGEEGGMEHGGGGKWK